MRPNVPNLSGHIDEHKLAIQKSDYFLNLRTLTNWTYCSRVCFITSQSGQSTIPAKNQVNQGAHNSVIFLDKWSRMRCYDKHHINGFIHRCTRESFLMSKIARMPFRTLNILNIEDLTQAGTGSLKSLTRELNLKVRNNSLDTYHEFDFRLWTI